MIKSNYSAGRMAALCAVLLVFVGLSAVPASGQLRRFRWIDDCGPCRGMQQGCQCQSCQGCGQVMGHGQVMPGQTQPGTGQPTPADPNNMTNPNTGDFTPSTQASPDAFAMSDQFGGGQGLGARDISIGDFFNNTGSFGGSKLRSNGDGI